MDRENFYLLLELSLDPPENREEVIQKAIDSLRAKWSRFRNHPTKSLQAKKIIGMIPEMRRVMLDPELRREEARRATEQLKKRLASKYSEIDRHITIRMSKGFMTDEEIFKLAKLHKMNEADIRARIRRKQEEKNAEIDKSIAIRMSKGYITEEEIGKIAKLHGVESEQVRQRIQGPIRKESAGSIDKLETLDKTIAGVISSNLEIVGKTSLYDFLGLAPGSSLELLQEKARQREAELHRSSSTDAVATASSILAGHCITLFKDENSRRLYDATLAQSHLGELNSDIEVAGMDGKIRAEYLDVLVERAVQFGMDEQEARQYIENYCRRRKWTIEKARKRRLSPVLVAVAVLAFAGAGFAAYKVMGQQRSEKAFEELAERVESMADPHQQQRLLKAFIQANAGSDAAARARDRLAAVRQQIVEKDYENMSRQAQSLIDKGDLDQAEKCYRRYLNGHRNSRYAADVHKKIASLAALRDQRDFESLQTMGAADVYRQVDAARRFLRDHPSSRYRTDAQKMVSTAHEAYYVRVIRDSRAARQPLELQAALKHLRDFLAIYPDDTRLIHLKELQAEMESRLTDQQALAALKVEAQRAGSDLAAVRRIYEDYLQSYPDSSVRDEVRKELQRIDERQKQVRVAALRESATVRLSKAGAGFKMASGGVFLDVKSGLMWALLDATEMLGNDSECLDYKAANGYIQSLTLGDYSDWRLPSPDELQRLYDHGFPPPEDRTQRYWTSKSYTRYDDADGWSKVVDVVDFRDGGAHRHQLDSRDCASVRAVRRAGANN